MRRGRGRPLFFLRPVLSTGRIFCKFVRQENKTGSWKL